MAIWEVAEATQRDGGGSEVEVAGLGLGEVGEVWWGWLVGRLTG